MPSIASVMIPLVDLKAQYESIRSEIDRAIARVIARSDFILGDEVTSFERAFAAACQTPFAVGVASGTAALELTLEAMGVGAGDEVVTTPFTFIATVEAIVNRGAKPVFVDIDERTLNLDVGRLAGAVTSRTKAIVPVHLYGHVADMDPILEVARRRTIAVVEDAAQAHLARYKGRCAGSLGEAGCFSFYPGKNLGAYGDAGMVVTTDQSLADRVRLLRNHGRENKYLHNVVGHGERLDTLQAAILGAKLPHLADWTVRRRMLAARYRQSLEGVPVALPAEIAHCEDVYHLFVVRTPLRNALQTHLRDAGIQTGIHYPIPLHMQPALARLGHHRGDFPKAESAAEEVLSLPLYPELTEGHVDGVANAVRAFFDRSRPC